MLVVGAGKAAASMAKLLRSSGLQESSYLGCYHTLCAAFRWQNIKCIETGHPVPDNAGEDAARDSKCLFFG